MVIAEISITPIGTGTTSERVYIQAAVDAIREMRSVRAEVTPMGTVLQGDLASVLEAVKRMHQAPFAQKDVKRLVTSIRIDDRRDHEETMEEMVQAVSVGK